MEDFTRNMLISCLCGLLFGLSWWMMIDIVAVYPEVSSHKHGLLYLPIALSTSSLLINAFIPNSSLVENFILTRAVVLHRIFFFLSMVLGFGGLLSSILLCTLKDARALPIYAVIGIPLLNAFILITNLTFKFALVDENEDFF